MAKTTSSGSDSPKKQSSSVSAPATRKFPIVPATIAVAAIVVVIAILAGGRAQDVEVVDGRITRIIATVDECAVTTIPLAVPTGTSMEDVANSIFDRLSRTTGVGEVIVYVDNPRVEINHCQSVTNDATLRGYIAEIGYLAQ